MARLNGAQDLAGMSPQSFTALLLFMIVALFTPGPNNTMLLSSGVAYGLKRSAPHISGINIGFSLMAFLVCLGLGAIFMASPLLHNALRIVCAAYLCWLAWKIAHAGEVGETGDAARPQTFYQAAMFQWVNPKAWMAAIAAAAYGIQGKPFASACIIAGVALVVGFPASVTWVTFGAGLRRFLKSPRALRVFNVAMALLLVVSALPLLLH